jgi:hypothetical protein
VIAREDASRLLAETEALGQPRTCPSVLVGSRVDGIDGAEGAL